MAFSFLFFFCVQIFQVHQSRLNSFVQWLQIQISSYHCSVGFYPHFGFYKNSLFHCVRNLLCWVIHKKQFIIIAYIVNPLFYCVLLCIKLCYCLYFESSILLCIKLWINNNFSKQQQNSSRSWAQLKLMSIKNIQTHCIQVLIFDFFFVFSSFLFDQSKVDKKITPNRKEINFYMFIFLFI